MVKFNELQKKVAIKIRDVSLFGQVCRLSANRLHDRFRLFCLTVVHCAPRPEEGGCSVPFHPMNEFHRQCRLDGIRMAS